MMHLIVPRWKEFDSPQKTKKSEKTKTALSTVCGGETLTTAVDVPIPKDPLTWADGQNKSTLDWARLGSAGLDWA